MSQADGGETDSWDFGWLLRMRRLPEPGVAHPAAGTQQRLREIGRLVESGTINAFPVSGRKLLSGDNPWPYSRQEPPARPPVVKAIDGLS